MGATETLKLEKRSSIPFGISIVVWTERGKTRKDQADSHLLYIILNHKHQSSVIGSPAGKQDHLIILQNSQPTFYIKLLSISVSTRRETETERDRQTGEGRGRSRVKEKTETCCTVLLRGVRQREVRRR